jgi:hypothetical protein
VKLYQNGFACNIKISNFLVEQVERKALPGSQEVFGKI